MWYSVEKYVIFKKQNKTNNAGEGHPPPLPSVMTLIVRVTTHIVYTFSYLVTHYTYKYNIIQQQWHTHDIIWEYSN